MGFHAIKIFYDGSQGPGGGVTGKRNIIYAHDLLQ